MAAAVSTPAQPAGMTSPTTPAVPTPQPRWTPSLPTHLMSLLNPFGAQTDTNSSHHHNNNINDNNNNNNHNNTTPNSSNHNNIYDDPRKPHLASSHEPGLPPTRPALSARPFHQTSTSQPPSPSRSSGSIMFAEPDTTGTSEDGSREGSIDEWKRVRRSTRPKTRYSLCHPVPESKVKQKLHRQPRSLLQLHRLQANARPLPALEVIPSSNFSVRLTRAITKVFHAKHGFCAHDLVVLKAEKYATQDEDAEERDVIGLICKGSREEQKAGSGKMLIHMASGQQWEAYSTPTGGYECCTTDEHGLKETVRWVPKRVREGKGASTDTTRKFNFSSISPNSRQHPVLARLHRTGLEINDTYRMPKPSVSTPLGTPKASAIVLQDAPDAESEHQNECVTDEATRTIISVTAIWVAMREGWSPNFRYDDKRDSFPGEPPNSPVRSVASPVHSPPGSPTPYALLENRSSILSIGSGIIRRASGMSRSNRNSIASAREESDVESLAPNRSASVNLGPSGRSRADSSATVLVHRAASNRRKKTEAMTSHRPDLHSEDNIHETSREDLAREYATPDFQNGRSSVDPRINLEPSPLARNPSTTPSSTSHPPSSHGGVSGGEGYASPTQEKSRSLTPDDKPRHRASTTTTDGNDSTRRDSHRTRPGHHPLSAFTTKKTGRIRRWLLCGASKLD